MKNFLRLSPIVILIAVGTLLALGMSKVVKPNDATAQTAAINEIMP
jgi:hypothetical protein